MALTKCVDCGAKMGETALMCLQCGAKPPPKTTGRTKIIAAIFAFIIGYSILKPSFSPPDPMLPQAAPVYPRAEISSHARALVRERSKDSDSLKFRNEFTAQAGIYCGEVNGKNSFGGYVGFMKFISNDKTLLMDEGENKTFKEAWQKFCTVQMSS
jgi:hypothetical protein